jgi:hypothetical protein
MIWAPHRNGATFALRDDGRSMMTTNVEEGAKSVAFVADHYYWLAGDFNCQELARVGNLLDAPGNLPVSTEDGTPLSFGEVFIEVPRCRNG